MGYRQRTLAQRLGLGFADSSYWRVSMPDADCFMYFIARMQRLIGAGPILYVEGGAIDDEVAELYALHAQAHPRRVAPMDRHSKLRAFHVGMGPAFSRPLNALAARKTYAQIGERMLVYAADGRVLLDGSRLGERVVRLSGSIQESAVRRFASGPLHGMVEWVEE